MNKNIIIIIVILLVVAGVWFAFGKKDDSAPQDLGTNQKIDVRVACESALAYTTFQSGAEADAFVEACIRGEHPDVIQRYIDSFGQDGAAI